MSTVAHKHIAAAWEMVWQKLFLPQWNVFRDYTCTESSFEEELPTLDEIKAQVPNPCGWGTVLENCMLNNGSMLECLIYKWQNSRSEEDKNLIRKVYRGMSDCMAAGKTPGFLPRSISPLDGRSYYINSSRDQYTHFVYSMWMYFHSGLADEKEKAEIIRNLKAIADRGYRNVTPENNYNMLRDDGKPGIVDAMRKNVGYHEVMRLPMFYLAAWDVSGEQKYMDYYREILPEALDFNKKIDFKRNWKAFALLQMQYSLYLIWKVEKEPAVRDAVRKIMNDTAIYARRYVTETSQGIDKKLYNWNLSPRPWRKRLMSYNDFIGGYAYITCGLGTELPNTFTPLRSAGEALIIQALAPDVGISPEQIAGFEKIINDVDFSKHHTYAAILVLGGWYIHKAKTGGTVIQNGDSI